MSPVLSPGRTGSPASSFAVGAHLLKVAGDQQATAAAAIVVDDPQWAGRRSAEPLTFMLRRLPVDPVIAAVIHRGPSGLLDGPPSRCCGASRTGCICRLASWPG